MKRWTETNIKQKMVAVRKVRVINNTQNERILVNTRTIYCYSHTNNKKKKPMTTTYTHNGMGLVVY